MAFFGGYDWSGVHLKIVFKVHSPTQEVSRRRTASTVKYQLAFKLSGRTDIIYGNDYLPYHSGSLLYLPQEERKDIRYDKTFPVPGEAVCVFFLSDSPLPCKPLLLPAGQNGLTAEPFLQLLAAFRRSDGMNDPETLSLFFGIVAEAERAVKRRETAAGSQEARLAEAEAYIRVHCTDEFIDPAVPAEIAGTTPEYFRHLFTRRYGVPPLRYQSELRAAEGKRLLADTVLSVTEVASALGFSSLNYFTRFFRTHTGLSPTAYRLTVRQETQP